MPVRKLRLSSMEQEKYLACAKYLRAGGLDVEVPEPGQENGRALDISQAGSELDSVVYALPGGGVGIAIWLRLVALKSGERICYCEIPLPWEDARVRLLEITDRIPSYKVADGLAYPRADVINHRISSQRSLRCGDLVEGVLVAQGFGSLPGKYRSGMSIRTEVRFFDQFDRCYPVEVELRVIHDRPAVRATARPKKYTPLFDTPEQRERYEMFDPEQPIACGPPLSEKRQRSSPPGERAGRNSSSVAKDSLE